MVALGKLEKEEEREEGEGGRPSPSSEAMPWRGGGLARGGGQVEVVRRILEED